MLHEVHSRGELEDGLRCRVGRRRGPESTPTGTGGFSAAWGHHSIPSAPGRRPRSVLRGLFHDARRGDTLRKCVLCPDCPPHKAGSWRATQFAFECHWDARGPHADRFEPYKAMAVSYSSLHRRPVSSCPTKCELSFGEEATGRAGSWLHIPHFVTRVPFCMLVGPFEYVRAHSFCQAAL